MSERKIPEIKSYRDTVLKVKDFQITITDNGDGKSDIIIPLTHILELQARNSFGQALIAVCQYLAKFPEANTKTPTNEEFDAKIKEWLA